MTVMMVGLVTMLATNAEAHYTIRWSRLFWCSTNVVGKLSEVDPIDPTAQAEFTVTTNTNGVRYRCSDGVPKILAEPVTLVARRRIGDENITRAQTACRQSSLWAAFLTSLFWTACVRWIPSVRL